MPSATRRRLRCSRSIRNFRNPYVQHWNFGVQRDLGFNTVWEISYAGSAGKKMYEFRNVNQPLPTTGSERGCRSAAAAAVLGQRPDLLVLLRQLQLSLAANQRSKSDSPIT